MGLEDKERPRLQLTRDDLFKDASLFIQAFEKDQLISCPHKVVILVSRAVV